MERAEQLAWGALDSCGVKDAERHVVIRRGGPAAYLAACADVPRPTVAHQTQIERFVESGGTVVGGAEAKALGTLLDAPHRPLVAYARGATSLLQARRRVAIVGTRMPSEYGLRRATEIAEAAVAHGAVVVSGGAQGIDEAAHRAALYAGGQTIAVLGQPIGRRDERPRRLRDVFDGRPEALSISLFGPQHAAQRWCWAKRNAYIAALADVVVIVQGGVKSGTLHTATYAKRLHRPILAIPGDPTNPLAGAANLLLRRGEARALIDDDAQLGEAFGVKRAALNAPVRTPTKRREPLVDASLPPLVQRLTASGPLSLDALAKSEQRDVAALLADLMLLELEGFVQVTGGLVRLASRS